MADIADQGNQVNEEALERALQKQLNKSTVKLKPIGECYNQRCAEELNHDGVFCNSKCASEYERNKNGVR